ncbi:MAG: hypothetical protein OYH76_09540 [Defluviicoccus sp.]|nr:hypothetical protein [Defluviicoccus sp.]MDE0276126.1 hypothetical protein [Defluviicoccus sp.]
MSAEIVTMLGGFATLLASGGTFATIMLRQFERLENRVDARMDRVESKVDDLAREVSELRGEFRGRFVSQPAAE